MGAEILCIGHSHIDSVIAAARAANVALDSVSFWPSLTAYSFRPDGSAELTADARARLIAPVFSFVGGAVHHEIGMFVHSRAFDFVWPEGQDLPLTEGVELVPYDALLTVMREHTQPFLEIMRTIRRHTAGSMFHIESPPTYPGEVVPMEAPVWVNLENARIAPAWFRYKLWRIHSAIVRDFCSQSDIAFVPHPSEAVDAQGFLATAFYGFPAHANQAYGALVLRQMRALMSGGASADT
jgi:hypothetical protein